MTDAEAREKWCPFSRIGDVSQEGETAAAINRNTGHLVSRDLYFAKEPPASCRCIASDCMAWRAFRNNGYCGLAGPRHRWRDLL